MRIGRIKIDSRGNMLCWDTEGRECLSDNIIRYVLNQMKLSPTGKYEFHPDAKIQVGKDEQLLTDFLNSGLKL